MITLYCLEEWRGKQENIPPQRITSPPGDKIHPWGRPSPPGSKFALRGEVKNGPLEAEEEKNELIVTDYPRAHFESKPKAFNESDDAEAEAEAQKASDGRKEVDPGQPRLADELKDGRRFEKDLGVNVMSTFLSILSTFSH
jgi:hypothetical protein